MEDVLEKNSLAAGKQSIEDALQRVERNGTTYWTTGKRFTPHV